MPWLLGQAAMARPAVRAPPGNFKLRAIAPYVVTRPRGIFFTSWYTEFQFIGFTALILKVWLY
jgi:hypothetical protein